MINSAPDRKSSAATHSPFSTGQSTSELAISSFAMPWIRSQYNYQIAFLFPAALMAVSFVVFAAGKRFYGVEPPKTRKTEQERREQWVVLRRILGLFIVVTFFWTIFDQAESTWTLFARDHLNLDVFGFTIDSDQIQGLNPVLIILLLPPITLLWHYLAKKGIKLRATDKMAVGFVLTMITMGVFTVAGFYTAGGQKVSILWEVGAYILITCAEVCISVVGLELAFTAAPSSMKSFVTACWLVTVFFGNILNAQVTPLYSKPWMQPGWYFASLTLLMIVVTVAFHLVAKRFNKSLKHGSLLGERIKSRVSWKASNGPRRARWLDRLSGIRPLPRPLALGADVMSFTRRRFVQVAAAGLGAAAAGGIHADFVIAETKSSGPRPRGQRHNPLGRGWTQWPAAGTRISRPMPTCTAWKSPGWSILIAPSSPGEPRASSNLPATGRSACRTSAKPSRTSISTPFPSPLPNQWHTPADGLELLPANTSTWKSRAATPSLKAASALKRRRSARRRCPRARHPASAARAPRAAEIAAPAGRQMGQVVGESKAYVCKPRWSIGFKLDDAGPREPRLPTTGPVRRKLRPFNRNLVHYNWHLELGFRQRRDRQPGRASDRTRPTGRWAQRPPCSWARLVFGGRLGFEDQGQTPNMQLAVYEFGRRDRGDRGPRPDRKRPRRPRAKRLPFPRRYRTSSTPAKVRFGTASSIPRPGGKAARGRGRADPRQAGWALGSFPSTAFATTRPKRSTPQSRTLITRPRFATWPIFPTASASRSPSARSLKA